MKIYILFSLITYLFIQYFLGGGLFSSECGLIGGSGGVRVRVGD